jgi:hypothetical protein
MARLAPGPSPGHRVAGTVQREIRTGKGLEEKVPVGGFAMGIFGPF